MNSWKTHITEVSAESIRIQGKDIAGLMNKHTFTDVIYLLHTGVMPTDGQRRLMDAMLVATCDHGPAAPSAAASRMVASGNRSAPEAAIAAGVLAIGDAHGGAGLASMEMIERGVSAARDGTKSLEQIANDTVHAYREEQTRLPGFGHRQHVNGDPRVTALFTIAKECEVAGDGVEFIMAVHKAVCGAIKTMPINVDAAIAAILYDLGFSAAYARIFFITGRVAGLAAQVMEEYTREKPLRIKIPVVYEGKS